MRKLSTIAAVSLLLFALVPSTVSAVEFSWDTPRLGQFMRYIQNLVTWPWTAQKDGQCADPDGVPVTCPTGDQAGAEAGAEIDPEGVPGIEIEVGAEVDPDGVDGG